MALPSVSQSRLGAVGGQELPFEAVFRQGKSGKEKVEIEYRVFQTGFMDTILFTIPEAACQLKIGTSTLRRYLRRKLLPRVILPGGDQRIRKKDLQDFIDNRTVGGERNGNILSP